jgi:uncharacterized protein (DUF779 family)
MRFVPVWTATSPSTSATPQLVIDVVTGGMFSVEGVHGLRFLTRSRVFDDAEVAPLGRSVTPQVR